MVDWRLLRTLTISVCLFLSVGLATSWYTSRLFPWIHLSVFGSVLVILLPRLVVPKRRISQVWSLALLCLTGAVYRFPMVLFPDTLPGNDPEKFALFARLTLLSGDYRLPGADFYGIAGGFHTYLAQTAAITGLSPESGTVVVGLLFGVWGPLVAAAFCLVVSRSSDHSYQAAVWAAAIASVAALSVRMTYTPIAHGIGTILLVTFLLVVIRQMTSGWRKSLYWFVLSILLVAMTLTHKMPALIGTGVVGAIWAGTRLSAVDSLWPWNPAEHHLSISVPLATLVATLVQQTIITSYFSRAIFRAQTSADTGFEVPRRIGAHPSAGRVPDTGLLSIFESHSHAPTTLVVAGLCWVVVGWYFVVRSDRPNPRAIALLSAIGSITTLVVFGLAGATVPGAPHPLRFHVFQETLLVALIGLGVVVLFRLRSRMNFPGRGQLHTVAFVLLVVLVSFHVFSSVAAPDYPGQQRDYLTDGEMAAKQFVMEYVSTPVYTDDRLMRQTPYPSRVTSKTDPWTRLGGAPLGTKFHQDNLALVDGSSIEQGRPTILHRPGEDIYETGAPFKDFRYQLTWDVEDAADRRYHRVYDSEDGLAYRHSST